MRPAGVVVLPICIKPRKKVPVVKIMRAAVMRSWLAMLDQAPEIACSRAEVSVVRGVAFVTCLEHIGQATLMATNVFIWEEGEWRLVHHHAGPLSEAHEPADPVSGGHLH